MSREGPTLVQAETTGSYELTVAELPIGFRIVVHSWSNSMCYKLRALLLLAVVATSASSADGQIYGPADTAPKVVGKPHGCNDWWPIGPSRPSAQGDTILSFKITAEGRVRDVSVLRSSHDRFLDDAAQACVLTWQYTPATHRDGTPYEVPWIVRVSWQIDSRMSPLLTIRNVGPSDMTMGMKR